MRNKSHNLSSDLLAHITFMGIKTPLRDLLGLIKDKASLSKAALLSKPEDSTLYPAVLRATTHSPHALPDDRHLSSLLVLGNGSRATASALITALMDRLHRTGNCVVALKCLIVIHHIIKRGPFILQDQLSVFPSYGGYNYLKLSNFRDGATTATWALSAWVRWYARYLETLLATSRVLGYFLGSSTGRAIRETQEDRISSYLNADLIKDVDSVVNMIEEICKVPDSLLVDNLWVKEIMGLLCNDHLSAVNEVLLRLVELKERLSYLSFSDSVELTCGLKRLQDCRERLSVLYVMNKSSVQSMWGLVQELRDTVGMVVYKDDKLLMSSKRRDKVSESARFERSALRVCDSVEFQSGRLIGHVNNFATPWVVDDQCVESNLL